MGNNVTLQIVLGADVLNLYKSEGVTCGGVHFQLPSPKVGRISLMSFEQCMKLGWSWTNLSHPRTRLMLRTLFFWLAMYFSFPQRVLILICSISQPIPFLAGRLLLIFFVTAYTSCAGSKPHPLFQRFFFLKQTNKPSQTVLFSPLLHLKQIFLSGQSNSHICFLHLITSS